MSRMVEEDFWQPPVDKKAVVKRELARIGLALDTPATISSTAPADQPGRDWPAEIPARDGFFVPDGATLAISPAFADILHYRPAAPAPRDPDAPASEEESIEGMAR